MMEKPNQSHDNRQQQLQLTPPSTLTQSQLQSHTLIQPHILFEFAPLECREEIDDKVQNSYHRVKQLIKGKSPKECPDAYLKFIAADPQANTEQLTTGLLVAILVEQDSQLTNRYYRDIVTFSKDNLTLFSSQLSHIITERFPKLKENPLKQCFWITNQLMKSNIASAEGVCSSLCRRAAGGDTSPKNLWLVENILQLLSENRNWLVSSTIFMIPTVVYTFLRLIVDHMSPNLTTLRQKEIEFVVGLTRERFQDCMSIGRDFIRLLYQVNKIPEFEKLWHDIFNNPKSLHPNYQNPLQILSTRTPRRLHCLRVTPEMERKIHFLATSVKFGNQKRYQDWFHKQYLSSPESLSLRCDLIRFICTTIHPTNEQLWSDIMPRWAIVGWLLTTCTTNTSANHCKLALFIDWLLYDPKVETIMNIEPAILVMYYSLRSHSNVTASLLDFLCKVHTAFPPKLSEHIKSGIKKSLQQILEKRVVQSLSPLFDNPKQDPGLRTLIRESFPEFCGQANQTSSAPISGSNNSTNTTYSNSISTSISIHTETNNVPISSHNQPFNNSLSDDNTPNNVTLINDATDVSNSNSHIGDNGISQQTNDNASVKVIYDFMMVPDLDFTEVLYLFDEPIRENLKEIKYNNGNEETRMTHITQLLSRLQEISEQNFTHILKDLGHCLAHTISRDFESRIMPSERDDDWTLEQSIMSPFFLLCKTAFKPSKASPSERPMSLLVQLSKTFEATGFLILYFLRVTFVCHGYQGVDPSFYTGYLGFCNQAKKDLTKCLMDDLVMAMTYDSEMFCFILPIVFGDIAASGSFHVTGNIELIHLVVSAIDPIYLQELVCLCLTGNSKVINKDDVIPLIESSLTWESWEQYSLWKLIAAQSVPVENYISILPKLHPKAHAEAMSCISINLQKVIEPTTNMIQLLMKCENKCDLFVSSIVRYWSMKTDVKELAKVISSLFDSRPSSPQMKRKGQSKTISKSHPALNSEGERILHLLEAIRRRAPKNKLFGQVEIQDMLARMESVCNDSQKRKFATLLERRRSNKKLKKTDREVT